MSELSRISKKAGVLVCWCAPFRGSVCPAGPGYLVCLTYDMYDDSMHATLYVYVKDVRCCPHMFIDGSAMCLRMPYY